MTDTWWSWGAVEEGGLSVTLDGTAVPVPVASSLVSDLAAGERVWCQMLGRAVVVHGRSRGAGGTGGGGGTGREIDTRDYPSLADALAAASAGDTVHVRGEHVVSDLSWPSSVTIDGHGDATLRVTGPTAALVLAGGARRNTIRGVRFQGTLPEGSTTPLQRGIVGLGATAANPITGLRIEDCVFEDIQGSCILLKHVRGFRIKDNEFTRYGYAGVGLYSAIDGNIEDNDLYGTGVLPGYDPNTYGIFLSIYEPDPDWGGATTPWSSDVLVAGNKVYDQAWEALDTHNGQRITFSKNHVIRPKGSGIVAVRNDPGFPMGCEDIVISDNVITFDFNTGNQGIILRGASNGINTSSWRPGTGTISGNTITRSGNADTDQMGAIYVAETQGVPITGNIIVQPRGYGVIVQNSPDTAVTGNVVRDVWRHSGTSAHTLAVNTVFPRMVVNFTGNVLTRGKAVAGQGGIPSGANINLAGYFAASGSTGVEFWQAGNIYSEDTVFPSANTVLALSSTLRDLKVRLSSAAPTTGKWARGDQVLNSQPSPGGPIGWVCTAAGTPGTWKPYGTISA